MLWNISASSNRAAALAVLLSASLLAGLAAAQVNIIYDTDFGPDVDDVGALAVLHALADNGEANILGAAISSTYNWAPGAVDAVNTFYGRPDLPIGANKNPNYSYSGSTFTPALANGNYGNDIHNSDDVPDAVSFYRELLSTQPDDSVTIVTVGFLTNVSDLLDSSPDQFSPLSGADLVSQKVHQMVTMGGGYPSSPGEFNFGRYGNDPDHGAGPYSENAVNNWPTRAVFSGAEIGSPIRTGAALSGSGMPDYNPVREAYEIWLGGPGLDRPSWDQTAVLYAVRGAQYEGTTYWTLGGEQGSNSVTNTGANQWLSSPDKNQAYLVQSLPIQQMENVIEGLMVQSPAGGWPDPPTVDPYDPIGTIFHYEFHDGSGTQVTDLSGNGNHGTLVGFQNTSAGAGAFGASEGWVSGGGLSFLDDTVRSYVDTGTAVGLLHDDETEQTKSFTLEFTANMGSPSGWAPAIASNWLDPDNNGFGSGEGALTLTLSDNTTDLGLRLPPNVGGSGPGTIPWSGFDDQTMHHVAVTYDRVTGELSWYFDGELQDVQVTGGIDMTQGEPGSDNPSLNQPMNFIIGNVGWAEYEQWDGVFEAVAVSDVLLEPETFILGPGIPADFDRDGDVDGGDFLAWQRGESPNGPFTADLALWQSEFGGGGVATAAVPEPSMLALIVLALAVNVGVRTRC